jgi:hypothetical protein
MSNLIITLTKEDIARCKQAAALRWQLARASGVVNQRKDTDSTDNDLDYLGLKAELAVAKAFNTEFRPENFGIDSGVDMFIDSIGIDVKATFHQQGHLLFKTLDAFKADLAILVTATDNDNVMKITGWISRDRFLNTTVQKDFGKGNCYVIPQDQLATIEDLWLKMTGKKYA